MIVYIDRTEWEELKYKLAMNRPLPIPFYGEDEFGTDERDDYVKIEIERVE